MQIIKPHKLDDVARNFLTHINPSPGPTQASPVSRLRLAELSSSPPVVDRPSEGGEGQRVKIRRAELEPCQHLPACLDVSTACSTPDPSAGSKLESKLFSKL